MSDSGLNSKAPQEESNDGGTRETRVEIANDILRIMASHGRRFFSSDSDCRTRSENPRISRFEIINGRLWYVDKYTNRRIFVHYEPHSRCGRWRGFSDGGTLQSIVEHLRDFIRGKIDVVNMRYFGPWPEWVCGGDLWGYGDDMQLVRTEIAERLQRSL